MIKDYHMHPTVVQDSERFAAFAEKAFEQGVEEVCITDHMPLRGSDAADRIPAGQVEAYCERVRTIASKYAGRLRVKLGIEVDFHPLIRDQIEAVLRAGDFDFILGSSHLQAIPECDIFNHVSTRNEYAEAMLQNTVLAAESGYFSSIAHIDMYNWIFFRAKRFPLEDDGFEEARHLETIDRALDAIRKADIRLELNTHFAANMNDYAYIYPSVGITQAALDKGIRFSYGSDSHRPEHVGIYRDFLHSHPVYGRALQTWEND